MAYMKVGKRVSLKSSHDKQRKGVILYGEGVDKYPVISYAWNWCNVIYTGNYNLSF